MNNRGNVSIIVASVMAVVLLAGLGFFGFPMWNVWQAGQSGEASLKRAEQTRKILVTQAQAEKDSAVLRAEAIAIVGKAAKEFPEYRQQEFLGAFAEALKEGNISQIMYIPTEAGIPITEAGRSSQAKTK